MAVSHPVWDMTFVAETDLSGSQFRAVMAGTLPNTVKICSATAQPLGILQNKPGIGQTATVRRLGTSKVVADGAFACWDLLKVAAADGKVDTATAMNGGTSVSFCVGTAMETSTGEDDIVEVLLDFHRYCCT